MTSKSSDSMLPVSKKHRRDSDTDSDANDELDTEAFAQMTRSQRKCHRERRRRSEVNKGFDDLTSLLWEIDATTLRAEIENRAQRGKKKSTLPTEDVILSRVDLINFSISLLRRLHSENEQRKEIITSLTRTGTSTFEPGVNLTLPSHGNATAAGEIRPLLATQEIHSSDTPQQRLPVFQGMMPPSGPPFQIGSRGSPSTSLNSQQILQRQALLDQLVRTQPESSGAVSGSIQGALNNFYSQQNLPLRSAMSSNRKGAEDLAAVGMLNPSAVGDGRSGFTRSNESAASPGSSNAEIIAAFLARQQHNRNVISYLRSNSNNFPGNSAVGSSAALPMRNPVGGVASSDATQQLLQMMQNRQLNANSSNNLELAQIEALLQQHMQQKPHGR